MECIHRGRKDDFLVAPYLSRSGKSRHLPFDLKKCADSVLVWKVRPSPPWYEGSRRIHSGGECFLGHAVSASVWKIAASPSGHKKCAVSALVWKTWFRKSHRIHSGREECFLGRAVPAVVWNVAMFPSWSERSHRSAFVWKVAPHPARAQGYFLRRAVFVSVWKMRHLPFGLKKCLAVSTLV